MTTNVNTSGVVFNDATTQNTASDYITTRYTGPGSWTAAKSGLKAVRITAQGAGGNGGTATGNTGVVPSGKVTVPVARTASSGGGGGGGFSIAWVDGSLIPGSAVPVTAGPGGTPSSFGSFVSATSGATGSPATAPTGAGASSAGGASGTGTDSSNSTFAAIGGGGGSGAPANGIGGTASGMQIGLVGPSSTGAGTGYGMGGGGSTRSSPGTTAGGVGSNGWVLVEEFY